MNVQQLEKKVRQDVVKVKKDLLTLKADRAAQLGRFETNVNHTADDLTSWAEDSVAKLSLGFEKLTDDARDTAEKTAATFKKDVRHGLRHYNAKAQEVVSKVPGGLAKKAARYPWVAISIALGFGLLLGSLLRPAPRVVDAIQV